MGHTAWRSIRQAAPRQAETSHPVVKLAVGNLAPIAVVVRVAVAPAVACIQSVIRAFARIAEAAGADALEIAAMIWGVLPKIPPPTAEAPGGLLPFMDGLKSAVEIPIIAAARITPELGEKALHWYIALIYQILCAVVRTRDRTLMRHYAETIARRRFVEGFDVGEVSDFLLTIGDVVSGILRSCPDLKGIEQRIYDFITMTFQLAADEIQDSYEFLSSEFAGAMDKAEEALIPANVGDLERIVFQIEDICQDMREDHLRDEIGKLRT